MSIAMGTRLHIIYRYKTTSVPILVLLSQNSQSYPLAAVLLETEASNIITPFLNPLL